METGELPDTRQALTETLNTIRERVDAFTVRPHHLVPDLVLFNYAVDVREHCQATLVLADSDIPRTAYACARAAMETAQDLAMLVREPTEYDLAGATAYVWGLIETERLQARFIRARKAMEIPIPAHLGLTVDEVVSQMAAKWAPHNAKAEAMLQTALTTLRAQRRRHWTGMNRTEIAQKIVEGPGSEGIWTGMDALYGDASIQSHPGIDWSRGFQFVEDGRISIQASPEHRLRVVYMAWGAAYASWLILEFALNLIDADEWHRPATPTG